MKKYISVFEMITRNSIYKVIAVLLGMVALEFALWTNAIQSLYETPNLSLETMIENSRYVYVLGLAFVLITVVLSIMGCNIGSNQSYTLSRLSISEKKVFLLQSVYNSICYLLLWVTQLAVLLLSAGDYMKKASETSNQTIFLAFYRNDLMHSILPLDDVIGWFVLFFIIVACGIAAAGFTYQQRRGKVGCEIMILVALTLLVLPRTLGEGIFLIILCCCVTLPVYWLTSRVARKEQK